MIGIFDSGLGGLTVLRAVRHALPEVSLCYLGDTARLPYGSRSADLVYRFTVEGVGELLRRGCPLVVVACNTASALALRRLQQEWLPAHFADRRVLGVIRPVVEHAVAVSRRGRIGVVGTAGTVGSGAYPRELTAAAAAVKRTWRGTLQVISVATPLLVPLVEEGGIHRPETVRILRRYLAPLRAKRIDTLVLGCTHYPMLLREFRQVMGRQVEVFDPAAVVARSLADYLQRHPEIASRLERKGTTRYLVTDISPTFERSASRWLGGPVPLERVELGSIAPLLLRGSEG